MGVDLLPGHLALIICIGDVRLFFGRLSGDELQSVLTVSFRAGFGLEEPAAPAASLFGGQGGALASVVGETESIHDNPPVFLPLPNYQVTVHFR
jgi:hypothetical protein